MQCLLSAARAFQLCLPAGVGMIVSVSSYLGLVVYAFFISAVVASQVPSHIGPDHIQASWQLWIWVCENRDAFGS